MVTAQIKQLKHERRAKRLRLKSKVLLSGFFCRAFVAQNVPTAPFWVEETRWLYWRPTVVPNARLFICGEI